MKEMELITELSIRLNWKQQEIDTMLTALGNVIGDKLANNDIVSLHGLGIFESKKKAERISVNPTNGKRYLIPPKLVLTFKPATPLKTHLKTLDNNE
jgi:DNA-binding protein HU-beta